MGGWKGPPPGSARVPPRGTQHRCPDGSPTSCHHHPHVRAGTCPSRGRGPGYVKRASLGSCPGPPAGGHGGPRCDRGGKRVPPLLVARATGRPKAVPDARWPRPAPIRGESVRPVGGTRFPRLARRPGRHALGLSPVGTAARSRAPPVRGGPDRSPDPRGGRCRWRPWRFGTGRGPVNPEIPVVTDGGALPRGGGTLGAF
jgi:hypothetical protein